MKPPEVTCFLALVVIAAIGLWMLWENARILIADATVLVSEDVSGVGFLSLLQWEIYELTPAAGAACSALLADACILDRDLLRVGSGTAVDVLSRTRAGTGALRDTSDLSRVDGPAAQDSHRADTVILRIVTVRIFASRRPAVALNRV